MKKTLISLSVAVVTGAIALSYNYDTTPTNMPDILAAKKAKGALKYDKPQEALDFFAEQRIPTGANSLDYAKYETALNQLGRMQPVNGTSLGRGAAPAGWEQLGPGNIGGRTRQLVIDPNTPDTMFTAAVAGGVWKTTDGGASWNTNFDAQANIAVSSLVMDPDNSDVLYAGTGEGYFNGDRVQGAGIFKTTNGGDNWFRLNSTDNSDFYWVNDLVVSPGDSNYVYAATRAGLYQSDDAGQTWTQTYAATETGGCLDLEMKSDESVDYIFASCGTFAQSTIYRNVDAQNNPNDWVASFTDPNAGRISLALAPSNEDVIYGLAASIQGGNPYANGLYAVIRSNNSGDTWNIQVDNTSADKLSTLLLSNPIIAFLEECGFGPPGSNAFFNQGWYDNIIRVNPVDPDVVWAGGVDLFRSDDGGQTWGIASAWYFDPADDEYAHADNHGLVFHPDFDGVTNNTLFATGDGGVFRSDNSDAQVATSAIADPAVAICPDANGLPFSDVVWTGLNNGYEITQFYNGAVYPNGDRYFGGTQDNGTLRGDDTTAGIWTEIVGGDGGYVAVNPDNTDVLYAETTRISIRKSVDGGANFAAATNGITDTGALFINPFIMDGNNPDRLWTTGNFAWRTDDAADNWVQANDGFGGASGSAIATAPGNADRVVIGTNAGTIFRTETATTDDNTATWASSAPRGGFVSSVTFKPDDANVVFATYSTFDGGAHVWKSEDAGATWAPSDGVGFFSVPNVPVHDLTFDPLNTDVIYLGTDIGVLVSTDGGQNWFDGNQGTFPRTVVEEITYVESPTFSGVYGFTHGRSTFRLSVREPIVDLIFADGFDVAPAP
ncbi:hypothetical protein [Marinicella sp. W31]|uniref:hypothetical protein n=1 Tax=Marinicella sp. W31 TaxID=3023713 RepID=UPI003756DDE8